MAHKCTVENISICLSICIQLIRSKAPKGRETRKQVVKATLDVSKTDLRPISKIFKKNKRKPCSGPMVVDQKQGVLPTAQELNPNANCWYLFP